MTARVVDVIADELWDAGVRRIHGIPGGGSNMELIDAATKRGLTFVLTHHETAAIFMASAEAELSGIPGVCLATVGPGVANSINGLAHCKLDRVPLILITDRPDDRATLHQAIDHRQLVEAAVKRSEVVVPGTARLMVRQAIGDSLVSPRGPLHLDLAPSVACAPSPESGGEPILQAEPPAVDSSTLAAGAELLLGSTRPVVLLGLGAREQASVEAVRSFVERFGLPVLSTYKAKGVVPDDHRLAAGLVTNGTLEGRVLDQADALLAVGFDTVELMPGRWRWQLPTVTIGWEDHDPERFPSTVDVHGDPAIGLDGLRELLEARSWSIRWDSDRLPTSRVEPREVSAAEETETGLAPASVANLARVLAPEGAIATVDAGSHMFAATLFWSARAPRRFLISNGLATMGYGVPAAIGASLAYPNELVVCFTGDGGLAMSSGELATAARVGARVIIVVFNDGTLNLIKIKQQQRGKTTRGLDFDRVDWASVARGMGLDAFSAADVDGLTSAFVAAVQSARPTLIDVRIDARSYGELLTLVRG